MRLKIDDADFLGCPTRGRRHDLHQTRGTHAGACIHDEAAFLANQSVHVGWVEVDLLGTGHHGVFERHRKALLLVDHALGALTGVDAAIPHFALARKVSSSQQVAVIQATLGVQVGGVVPLAHTLGAQADLDGVKAANQASVFDGSVFFLGEQRGRACGHGDALA